MSSARLGGSVHGGQQPVSGAIIQLYAAGNASGSSSTALLTQTVTSGSDGTFSIANDFTCPAAAYVYLVATGGNPGIGSNNPNLALMTAIGPCSTITSSTLVQVNELTTVAAVSALAPYMSSYSSVGSSDLTGLGAAFTLASELVSPSTGAAPGSGVPAGATIPATLLNTLADVISSCVNSAGGGAADGSNCGTLFSLATTGSAAAPTNTISALLNLAYTPTANTASLFGLVSSTSPFVPALTSAPTSFFVSPSWQSNAATPQISPSSLTFPVTAVASTSAAQTVTIANNASSTPITISAIRVAGLNAGEFSQTNNCPASLASNSSCSAQVSVTPTSVGAQFAFLVVESNSAQSPQYIPLSVNNPVPTVTSFNPNNIPAGSPNATTVLLLGTNLLPSSIVQVNGMARKTIYFNSNELEFQLTSADQATPTNLSITVMNPVAGGGTSTAATLVITAPPATPVITAVTPNSIVIGSPMTTIDITGTGFSPSSMVQWNGATLSSGYTYFYTSSGTVLELVATVPASYLTTAGTASVTVSTPNANPSVSNAVTVSIVNPPVPTLTSLSPSGGPLNLASAETLTGTGFTANTTVAINGVTIPSTFVNSTEITANFPASALATPGNKTITVTTPAPGGGTSAAQAYTTFISIPNNDIVYSPTDGLIYASVPAEAVGGIGNSVVGIDPNTGAITRKIQVGTDPNKLAISTDGTQLFVGIDGAGAVAQVNLAQGQIVNQFSLGGGQGIYNPPSTALYLAAVPGLPNSVAVSTSVPYGYNSAVTIFDSGVARTGSSVSGLGQGPLGFGASASTLYLGSSYVDALTVASTGITASSQIFSSGYTLSSLQYDNGSLYLSDGQVLNASTGGLNGTFYSVGTTQANGPIVSDSTLGKAFMALSSESNYYDSNAIYVFNESNFNLVGTIPANALGTQGYPTNFSKIVRWGQNGVAAAAVPSAFTANNQIYIFQSPLVKDLSSSPADLAISLSAPAAATTGTAVSYIATITNGGPSAAAGTSLFATLDPSLVINSILASQGSCTVATTFSCDLGGLANGASVTVTVRATPTNSGTLAATASVSSSSYDSNFTNNQATASTTVTGSLYGAAPSISSISPNLVQAGSAAFTLAVTGTGFNAASTVNLGTTPMQTTYVSSTQLTASVPATAIANYGWAAVSVTNPMPGGGVSPLVPLTIYDLVSVQPNAIAYDPYAQSLYATIPSNATGITGNSLVSINPYTGVVGSPIPVGSQPTVMAETSDGNYLYISVSGADSLAKFNLLTQSIAATIPITYNSGYSSTSQSVPATTLAAMPGSDTTLAVGINIGVGWGIFDVNGNTGSFRTNFSSGYAGTNPVFASPTEVYAYDNQTTGSEFYRYSVNASGVTLMDGTTLNGMGGFSGGFQLANGTVYGYAGAIANPSTTPPSQIQTLPAVYFPSADESTEGVGVVADPSLQKDFLLVENGPGSSNYGLVRYDLNSYLPEAVLAMPNAPGVYANWTMQRFGQDGLALLSYDSFAVSPPVVQLILLRGPFIAPQELSAQTSATLTSSSASSITHGSGNLNLTVTGSNFLPGVGIFWNGAYRTTTVVNATQVTVAIPASDLATPGTASLTAVNPGASASNAITVTIN